MKKIISIILCAAIFCSASVFAAENNSGDSASIHIYVSPNGSDNNDASINKPLATLAAAQKKAREVKKTAAADITNINIILRGGEYTLERTLEFSAEDSGSENCRINWKAYDGEQPVISGGKYISPSAMKKVTDRKVLKRIPSTVHKSVRMIDLRSTGMKDFGAPSQYVDWGYDDWMGSEVFVGDKAYELAKWPNNDKNGRQDWVYANKQQSIGNNAYQAFLEQRTDANRIASWQNPEEVIINGPYQVCYFSTFAKLGGVKGSVMDIIDCPASINTSGGGAYSFYNVLEELDVPGEYYIDRKSGILYLIPDENAKNGKIKISSFSDDWLVSIVGANYVNFDGIDFELSRNGDVNVQKSTYINFYDCGFNNSTKGGLRIGDAGSAHSDPRGNWGVENYSLETDTNNITVDRCRFLNNGYYGVRISAGNSSKLERADVTVKNSYFYNSGRVMKTYAPGMSVFGCGIDILNNHIEHTTHAGMNCGGTFVNIMYNEINDVMRDYSDQGFIYSATSMPGSEIAYNYLHDTNYNEIKMEDWGDWRNLGGKIRLCNAKYQGSMKVGVYKDGYTYGGHIHHNIFKNMLYGVYTLGWNTPCDNNIFIDAFIPIATAVGGWETEKFNSGQSVLLANNHTRWMNALGMGNSENKIWKEKMPEWFEMRDNLEKWSEEGDKRAIIPKQTITDNLFLYIDELRPFEYWQDELNGGFIIGYTDSIQVSASTIERNEVNCYDPGFVNIEKSNYTLREDAGILKTSPGLAEIDMNKIGIQPE